LGSRFVAAAKWGWFAIVPSPEQRTPQRNDALIEAFRELLDLRRAALELFIRIV